MTHLMGHLLKITLFSSILMLASSFATTASAQEKSKVQKQETFTSTFEMVVDNCKDKGFALQKSPIHITAKGDAVTVTIESLPTLKGKARRLGKIRAKATGQGKTEDIRVNYGFSGRITKNKLQAVLVAELFADKKPLCTQSWSVAGISK